MVARKAGTGATALLVGLGITAFGLNALAGAGDTGTLHKSFEIPAGERMFTYFEFHLDTAGRFDGNFTAWGLGDVTGHLFTAASFKDWRNGSEPPALAMAEGRMGWLVAPLLAGDYAVVFENKPGQWVDQRPVDLTYRIQGYTYSDLGPGGGAVAAGAAVACGGAYLLLRGGRVRERGGDNPGGSPSAPKRE